jgi:nitroreductase
VIDAATQAPNGSNRQRWRFVIIRDPGLRRRVGEVYRRAMDELIPPEEVAKDVTLVGDRLFQVSAYLAEHIGVEPPVLILVCQESSSAPAREVDALLAARSRGASVYPAVQNLLLAARACGLGGCLTTTHVIREEEIKAILGIPSHVNTFALVPLGYPQDHFGAVRRRPVSEVTFVDEWGTPFVPAKSK